MKPTRSVRIGRICKKHPDENGLRYVGNNRCVECAKEESRKHYASLEMTPAQKITTLLGEIAQLKAENSRSTEREILQLAEIEALRNALRPLLANWDDLRPGESLNVDAARAALGKGEQS